MSARRILIHCPEALLTPHMAAMAFAGRTLANAGHSVMLSLCAGAEERCVIKDSHGVPAGQALHPKACFDCTTNLMKAGLGYRLPMVDLRLHASHSMREEIKQLVDAVPEQELRDFADEGVRFGYHCYQDLILLKKLMWDEPLDADGAGILREQIRTAMLLYRLMKDLLRTHRVTDLLVFEQYSQNTTVVEAAKALGLSWRILTQSSHLNLDRRRIEVRRNSASREFYGVIDAWPQWRDRPLSAQEIEGIGDDILYRMRGIGSHVYSPGKSDAGNIRQILGLAPDRKLIVAYTSSFDEILSQKSLDIAFGNPARPSVQRPFETQHDWLRALVDWVAGQDDLQLVIRIHPREDKNKRDGVTSTNYHRLKAQLAQTPANVTVVWPADPVSSYDLAEAADQVQTSWSTLGLECARMGIPTLASETDNMTYPVGDFIGSGDTVEAFFQSVRAALDRPPSFEAVVRAFRFYALSRFRTSFDFSEVVPGSDFMGFYPFKPAQAGPELVEAVLQDTTCIAVNDRLYVARNTEPVAKAQAMEAAGIRRQLARLLRYLMTGEDCGREVRPLRLRAVSSAVSPEALESEGWNAATDRSMETFLHAGALCAWAGPDPDGKAFLRLRHSPLAARLTTLLVGSGDRL
ncbi:hypothetical protein [Azospirillum soli]|uniref:hypothetical protein n=1 Tax=Azospirillum soli TaxID=1304799 RepID=UPI001AE7FDCB|nr:hypothetical protein [Azospirillum soli]MBP2316823.1 hypothetical protein [Azospirillum soli]